MSWFLAFLAAVTALPGAARADVVVDPDLVAEAQIWAIAEIDLLGELGAFTSDPIAELVADEYPTPATARIDVIGLLELSDEVNEGLLVDLRRAGADLSTAATRVLAPLPDDVWDRIDDGEQAFLDPRPWLEGTADLIARDGRPGDAAGGSGPEIILDYLGIDDTTATPAAGDGDGDGDGDDRTEPTGSVAATTSPTGTPEPAGAPSDEPMSGGVAATAGPGADDTGPPVTLLVALAALALVGLAASVAVLRRRARRTGASVAAVELLDTSRRLAGALDPAAVRRIAVDEARRSTGADAGAFVGASREVELASDDRFITGIPIAEGIVDRVMETGQSVRTVLAADPCLTTSAAVAATPVIARGEVAGALVVARQTGRPFDRTSTAALELLAPVVGSALVASTAHDSAVADAERDALTTLHNRRRLDRDLERLGADHSVAFAMIDVDHFKAFNDTHGHRAGDRALQVVAQVVSEHVRTEDVVYRYGGEEFSVLLPGATLEEAEIVMERVRLAVADAEIRATDGSLLDRLTVSIGLCGSDGSLVADALAERADRALYAAKAAGRDRVVTGDQR